MLEDTLHMTRRLIQGDDAASFTGKHFTLDGATLLPRPGRQTPILVGGTGPQRTLPLAGRIANEWNAVFCGLDLFRERSKLLDELEVAEGRDPGHIKRSMMTAVRWCEDDSAVERLLEQTGKRFNKRATIEDVTGMGVFEGTSEIITKQTRAYCFGVRHSCVLMH